MFNIKSNALLFKERSPTPGIKATLSFIVLNNNETYRSYLGPGYLVT